MTEQSTNRTERYRKTAHILREGLELKRIDYEVRLMATDSWPKLQLDTVEIEDVTRTEETNTIEISGVPQAGEMEKVENNG